MENFRIRIHHYHRRTFKMRSHWILLPFWTITKQRAYFICKKLEERKGKEEKRTGCRLHCNWKNRAKSTTEYYLEKASIITNENFELRRDIRSTRFIPFDSLSVSDVTQKWGYGCWDRPNVNEFYRVRVQPSASTLDYSSSKYRTFRTRV